MTLTNTDSYGRKHTYLRISLTDKCNLSCLYCYPSRKQLISLIDSKKQALFPRALSADEIIRFLTIMSCFGIKKVRFSGGEPLLRRDLCEIIEKTKKIYGIKKICLTTNGTLLKNKVALLKNAGLDSINVSLDSLNKRRFKKITGSNAFYDVLDGIYLCIAYGLKLKINVVVLEDLSLQEVDAFVKFAIDNSIAVRFIEKMPFYRMDSSNDKYSLIDKIEKHIARTYGFTLNNKDGVARNYTMNSISIGFISPLSYPFCDECNRLRLSSNGKLYRCLFDPEALDIKPLLDTSDKKQILQELSRFLLLKRQTHSLNQTGKKLLLTNSMRFIGG